MIKIDFSTILHNIEGEPFLDDVAMQSNGGTKVELTLGRAASNPLLMTNPKGGDVNGKEKFDRSMLAVRVYGGDTVDLKAEEVTKLKTLIGDLYSPLVVYRAWQVLDPATE